MLNLKFNIDYFLKGMDNDFFEKNYEDIQAHINQRASSLLKEGYVSGEFIIDIDESSFYGWCDIDVQVSGMVNGKKDNVIDYALEDISKMLKQGYSEGQIEVSTNGNGITDTVFWGVSFQNKDLEYVNKVEPGY